MAGLKYDKILSYKITVQCDGPLRIGSAIGNKEEVLIHPVDQKPFVQASSIAGVLRGFYGELTDYDSDRIEKLFGSPEQEEEDEAENGQQTPKKRSLTESRVKVTDGEFKNDKDHVLTLELRPHVKINRETGSADAAKIKGTEIQAGQKFNLEYIGKGSVFSFGLEVYEMAEDDLEGEINQILAGLKAGNIQFGGKKSSGAGAVKLIELKFKSFDLRKKSEREEWIFGTGADAYVNYIEKLPEHGMENYAYRILVSGKTEGAIQVKGIAVSSFGKNAPDSENMRNAQKEFIVPGSSFKGTVRAQMEKIAEYIGKSDAIEEIFGKNEIKDGKSGNLVFYDTVISDKDENGYERNAERRIQHRIHIDKFTGGVFNKGLFNEKNAAGFVEFAVDIKKKHNPDMTLGLLLLALRDLAVGLMSVGNGYSTGKGIIDVSEIRIEKAGETSAAVLNFQGKTSVEDPLNMIDTALKALKGGSK